MCVPDIATCTDWPKYTTENQVNFVYDANITDYVTTAPDNYRAAEIDFVMKNVIGAT